MGNKNTVIRFLKDKGFYIALAVCIVGATAAAWATASRTLDSIEQNNRQIVEQGVSGEEKPQWSSSSTAPLAPSSSSAEDAQKPIPNTEKPSPSSSSAQPSFSVPAPSSGSAEDAAAPVPQPEQQTFVYTRPLEGGKVINPYSGGQLVKNMTLNVWRTHDAIDLQGEKGAVVRAIGDGKVVSVTNDALWGGMVQVEHPDGYTSCYSGLAVKEGIKAGEQVVSGQEIGTLGDIPAEISAEPHLHLSLMKDGKAVDPGQVLTLG